ncbi:MAG: hypothetical protein AM324_014340 [Candidatus Thorarchaeota archaeon SMTZ1-83]|nr:MAG: hypothetical protein AM324_15465 [Candidatus Thorarchaeota archaeon SMTZ1-83]
MSSLEDRPLDKLADTILNVLWQDLLEVWSVIRKKMDNEGEEAVRIAFEGATKRFLEGPFEDHLEVRWGMDLCVHCNDNNIEKNGIAYVKASGDGLEFNQCLNCRVGILYDLVAAKAMMDTYNIALGKPGQYNGMSFFWNAIVPDALRKCQPTYEIVHNGQWIGTVSFDMSLTPKFLSFSAMTESVARDSDEPWTTEIPNDLRAAIDAFLEVARHQVEVALIL